MPTIRPKVAPTAMEGTKMPAGTLHPYEMTTRHVRMTVARRSELTIRHCAHGLYERAIEPTLSLCRSECHGAHTHWQRFA